MVLDAPCRTGRKRMDVSDQTIELNEPLRNVCLGFVQSYKRIHDAGLSLCDTRRPASAWAFQDRERSLGIDVDDAIEIAEKIGI